MRLESQLSEANKQKDHLRNLMEDKEEEFETQLKAKVVEWKTEFDAAEEGLRDEIRKLKSEVRIKLRNYIMNLCCTFASKTKFLKFFFVRKNGSP